MTEEKTDVNASDPFHDLPADEQTDQAYRASPGFNQSTANQLISYSPLHAYRYSRRDRSGPDPDHSREREIGTVIHKLILGSTVGFRELSYDDYRTKDAQHQRATAEREGVTPILTPDLQRCRLSCNAVREQLLDVFGIELDGQSERAIYWREDGLECKAKLDHIRADGCTILDIKSGQDANPRGLVRRILQSGCHVQAAAYSRALAATDPSAVGRIRFLDIFVETAGLIMVTPVEITGALLELGERQWQRACSTWQRCQREAYWPGYVTEVQRPECPAYALEAEMNHE